MMQGLSDYEKRYRKRLEEVELLKSGVVVAVMGLAAELSSLSLDVHDVADALVAVIKTEGALERLTRICEVQRG